MFLHRGSPFSFSIVILYLRFGAQVLQDNFVAELSAHYQNYILVVGSQACGLPVFMVNTLALDIYKG